MKKTLSIIALSIIGFGLTSCKKENKEVTGTEVATDSAATAATPGDSASTKMLTAGETPAPASNQPLTTIALSENSFDFGNIKKGDKVVISEVKPGCGCTAGDFTKEPIMPGKKGKITLHFDSTNFDGNVSKFADVYANVEKAPIKLTFTANIQP
jgi:hypothetical protein